MVDPYDSAKNQPLDTTPIYSITIVSKKRNLAIDTMLFFGGIFIGGSLYELALIAHLWSK